MQRDTVVPGVHSSIDITRMQQQHQQHGYLQHGVVTNRPDITTTADVRDQEQQGLVQLELDVPITYMPFKFENRRVRIDWRLLHGVDIDKLVRDTDLDTLEQLVTCVTWGDIESEDTRHLSEGNFVKVFRLAQLLLEYLLFVQENLKYTNSVLDRSRSAAVLHATSLSTRYRDLHNQLKHCKRELKRAHKTVKTFELMAAAVGGAAAAAQAASAAAAATPAKQEPAAQQQQQQQLVPQQGGAMTAGEMLLQSQLAELTERLTLAVCEAERLRTERQELQYQIRHLHDTLAAKISGTGRNNSGGGGSKAREAAAEAATAAAVAAAQQEQQQLFMAELQCAQAQIEELQAHNKDLKSQLKQQSDAVNSASAAESAEEDLRAQLEEQAREMARLQSELREKEASISVFQNTNTTLQQQLDALQRQLASPEATTPSFVAKQRQQLAAAATAQAGLQTEKMRLRQELLELRLALEAKGMNANSRHSSGAGKAPAEGQGQAAEDGDEDTLAAAERLLSGDGEEGPAGAAVGGAGDWKVQEIERLQEENRQLQAKVSSLQEALYGMEATNARLEKRLAAAQAAGYGFPSPQSSPSAAATSAAAVAAMAGGLSGVLGGSGWASVSSSGPAAELTAADLATGGAVRAAGAAAGADADTDTAVDSVQLEQSDGSVGQNSAAAAAAAAAGPKDLPDVAAADAAGKIVPTANVSEGGHIAAYRPSRGDTAGGAEQQQEGIAVSSANTSSNGSSSVGGGGSSNGSFGAGGTATPARGAIDQAAAQQLKGLVAQLQAELTPELLAGEYAEVCCDWDKPFDLTDNEKAQFRKVVPQEVAGLKDVLCSGQHTAEEVSAAKPGMLAAINRILDAQVASYGIHPGRTGLSNIELLAALKMLSERREAFEAKLTSEQRSDVEITRLGLLLHPYHALQSVMGTLPDGPDGKKHLPAVTPALASAVRPPASSSLPPPPPPIRLQPRGPSPLASPGGFGMPAAAAGAAPVTLYAGSAGASPSPSASARYGIASGNGAACETESEDGHSPVKRQEMYSTLTYHAGAGGSNSGVVRPGDSSGGGVHVRAPSPLGSEAAREAIAKATASGSFSPMSAALHVKQQLLGSPGSVGTGRSVSPVGMGSSPLGYASGAAAAGAAPAQGSPVKQQQAQVVRLSPTGVAPPAAVAVQAQQQKGQQVSAAAALATKQYLGTSFEDSDDF